MTPSIRSHVSKKSDGSIKSGSTQKSGGTLSKKPASTGNMTPGSPVVTKKPGSLVVTKKRGSLVVTKKPASPVVTKRPSAAEGAENMLDTVSQVSAALSRSETLNDKLQLLRNSDLNEAEKMELLQKSLLHKDWKAIHGRVQTAAAKDSELRQDLAQSEGADRRKTIAAWLLDPKRGVVYRRNSACIQATQTFSKNDTWVSELKMLQSWTCSELEAHLNSGRIISRECPHTPGVWEYKDLHDVSSTKTVAKNRETMATMESEFHPEDDEEMSQFKSFFDSIQGTDNPAVEEGWRMGPKGKGGGKGVLGKGVFGKSDFAKGSSRSSSSKKVPLPLSEEEQIKNAQKRIKTLQTWCRAAQSKIKCTLFEKKNLPTKVKNTAKKLLLKVNETEQDLCDGEDNPALEKKADSITNACGVLAEFRALVKACESVG
jgi:hypothetical protein